MAKGMNPAYSGVLLTDDKDPKKWTILGRMALWESVTIKENSP